MMTLDELKQAKRATGLSYKEISKRSGVPLGTVQKVFSGITNSPRHATLLALDKAFSGFSYGSRSGKADAASYRHSQDETDTHYYNEKTSGGTYTRAPSQPDYVREPGIVYGSAAAEETSAEEPDSDTPAVHLPPDAGSLERYPRQGTYRIKDYLALPDEQRVELIDGFFYDMAAPYPVHQDIDFMLGHYFQNYIEENGDDCRVLPSPIDVQLDKDDKTVVQPDLCIVCEQSIIKGPRLYGAPDLLIEVLSKSTRRKDLSLKNAKYCNAGVREYWTVDPENLKVIVFDYENGCNVTLYGFHDKVPAGIYGGKLVIDFEKIYQRIQGLYGVGKDE